ncbi:MAG: hypothetical protein IJM53_06255, partial [Lachnospiraceae bacterium]|nr:hypothetical protein [Lachnospiraceae bacterium]
SIPSSVAYPWRGINKYYDYIIRGEYDMRGIEQNQGELAAQETIGKKNHTDIDKPLPVDDEKQLIISKMQSKREINPGMDEAVDAEPQDCDSIPLTICKTDQEEKPRVERLGTTFRIFR